MTHPTATDDVAESDDPGALPPRLARRAVRDRIPWGMLALEGFFTVVAILLALAADDWRERREERELADGAIAAFVAELTANRERIDRAYAYHDSLRTAMIAALSDTSGRTYRSPNEIFPQWRGVSPAFVTHAAWETAVATGALRHLSPEALRALSLTYELQARLDAMNRTLYGLVLDPVSLGATDFRLGTRLATAYLSDALPNERELSRSYEQTIALLRAEAGR
jgi:hypothetical protein